MSRIAASILAADFSQVAAEVSAVEEAGVDWLHVDVMDGHFVPNISIGVPVVEALNSCATLPLDVHLMIEQPERYIEDFIDAGARYLSVHIEACPHVHGIVQRIRDLGAHPAVALNPGTPLSAVGAVLGDIDMLLVMSVDPGFGGQGFIPSAIDKIEQACRLRKERGLEFLIEVDGGIKGHNAGSICAAGADVLVVGTGIFKTENYANTVADIRRRTGSAARVV